MLKCNKTDLEAKSIAECVALLNKQDRLKIINELGEDTAHKLLYEWSFWAREKQIMPEGNNWTNFLLLAGRGYGKTFAGAQAVREVVEKGEAKRIALVAETPADARDVMIEGESGLLNIFPPNKKPIYQPSKRKVIFDSGAVAHIYSSYKPDQLRGPQHDFAWCDELASWRYMATFDNLLMGLRLGDNPRCIITTTPRPIPIIKELIEDENTKITRGTTYENINNLPQAYFNRIIKKYEGTRLGRQELKAEILSDNPNALWNRDLLEELRRSKEDLPALAKIVIAIDPATTSNEKSDETGIIVAGIDEHNQGYVLEDLSLKTKPNKWAEISVNAYEDFQADCIIAESNQGGDMVKSLIKTVNENVPVKLIHASRGKYTRAEPVSALYEQKRIYHIGSFPKLEDQLCNWVQGEDSPDRLDALVWALTELILNKKRKIKKVKPTGLGSNSKWRR